MTEIKVKVYRETNRYFCCCCCMNTGQLMNNKEMQLI